MRIFYKTLVLVAFAVIGLFQTSKATHISGGDISYECVGKDSFLITVNLFRDCDGISAPTSASMSFSSDCGGSVTANLQRQSLTEISQLCPAQIPNSTCSGGTWPGMEQAVYTGIVVLSPPCNAWRMSWSSCCRNNQVSNLVNPGGLNTYLFTTMFSGIDSCNTSPTFTSMPIPYVCKNQVVNYNFGVVEPDGDSIVYFMSPGYETALTTVPYAAPYTFAQPLPGANAVLNTFNGQLTFTPTLTGVYVIVVRIEEYDRASGVIKGTSIRDVQVVVQNCSNIQPEVDAPGIFNFSGSGTQVDSNTVDVCIGDSFSFDVSFSDPDTLQTVSLFHNIYSALDSTAEVTITNGNPAIINVKWTAQPGSPPFTSFMVTGIDDACPVAGIVSSVFNVNIFPSTYAGPDESICQGTQWQQLNVTGGENFTWFVISGSQIDTIPTSPGYNMTCWHCDDPQVSPQVTTTYGVFSDLVTTACKTIDTVIVEVNPNFNVTMPNDTIICPIDSINLPVSTDQPTFNYSYQWSHPQYMDNDTIANPKVLPLAPTVFTVTVTAAGGCEHVESVFVDLAPAFPPNLSIFGDTVICLGDSTQLEVVLGEVPSPFCGISTSPCVGNNLSGVIGTESLTNGQFDRFAPYKGTSKSARSQYLFLASELYAMGMTSGKIQAISFENLVAPHGTFDNYQVKIGCTSSNNLSSGWETGLFTVLPAYTHTATTGWNKHTFSSEYDWDGISNIVVEICFSNPSWVPNGTASSKYSTFNFQCTRSAISTSVDVCSGGGGAVLYNSRPNIRFDFCTGANPNGFNYAWTPNTNIDSTDISSPKVYPTQTTTYTVIVQDTFGSCSDTVSHEVEVVTKFDAGFNLLDTICINGGLHIAIPNVGGGYFTGTGIIDSINGVFDPAIAGVGTYGINYTVSSLSGGCSSDSTEDVTVIPKPNSAFTPKEFCVGSNPDTLFAVTPGGTWKGAGIIDTTYGIFDPAAVSNAAGDYPVTYTLTDPCLSVDTQLIRIIEPYSFNWTSPQVDVCQESTLDLNNNFNLSGNPLQGSGPIIKIWSDANGYVDTSGVFDATNVPVGNYVVTLSIAGVDSTCGETQTMTVTVREIDYANAVDELAYCSDNNSAKIYVSPWLYGAGVSFTQTPISPLGATDTLNISAFGQNGQFDATIHGVGQWQFEITMVNQYGCAGVTTDTIHVLDTPEKPILDEARYCEGDEIWLSATGVNQDSIYWYATFLLDDTIGIGNPQYYGITPHPDSIPNGMFVWVTENNWACVSPKQEYKLPIYESPSADFVVTYTDTNDIEMVDEPHTLSPIYGFSPFLVQFNALYTNSTDTITWFHNWEKEPDVNAMNPNYTNSPSVQFNYKTPNLDKDGQLIDGADTYITRLFLTNEYGCADTSEIEIYSIASEEFYNVFTPNGDGQNDVFYVPVFGLENYRVQIFNRWGKLVYEWEDPEQGWNGEGQPDGVYFYVVTGINPDANRTEYKQQGSVTLTGTNL